MKIRLGELRKIFRSIIKEYATQTIGSVGEADPNDRQRVLHDDVTDAQVQNFVKQGWKVTKAAAPNKRMKTVVYHPEHWQPAGKDEENLYGLVPTTSEAKKIFDQDMRYYKSLEREYN